MDVSGNIVVSFLVFLTSQNLAARNKMLYCFDVLFTKTTRTEVILSYCKYFYMSLLVMLGLNCAAV
jgi:hypothetical protein